MGSECVLEYASQIGLEVDEVDGRQRTNVAGEQGKWAATTFSSQTRWLRQHYSYAEVTVGTR